MLNVQRMHLLVELKRRGTLAAVARALSYSPSTLSQQLAQLETEAGVALTEQAGRKLVLTCAGEILVRHAKLVLEQLEQAEADLAATRSEVVGVVRVAMFPTAAVALVSGLLDTVVSQHPALELHLREIEPDTGNGALLAREFDLVLGESYPGRPLVVPAGIEQRVLLSDPLRLYAANLGQRRTLKDFADAHWVFEPKEKPARVWAETVCRAAGFEPVVRYESTDLWVQAQIAETGHAVALLPNLVWASRPPSGSFVDLPGHPMRKVFTAVRSGSETHPAIAAIRCVLDEVAGRQVHGAHHPESGLL